MVWYNQPRERRPYVNSLWPPQKDPFARRRRQQLQRRRSGPGGSRWGPSTSSRPRHRPPSWRQAAAIDHIHRTIHFEGPLEGLEAMATACLGVGLKEIEAAFPAAAKQPR